MIRDWIQRFHRRFLKNDYSLSRLGKVNFVFFPDCESTRLDIFFFYDLKEKKKKAKKKKERESNRFFINHLGTFDRHKIISTVIKLLIRYSLNTFVRLNFAPVAPLWRYGAKFESSHTLYNTPLHNNS